MNFTVNIAGVKASKPISLPISIILNIFSLLVLASLSWLIQFTTLLACKPTPWGKTVIIALTVAGFLENSFL